MKKLYLVRGNDVGGENADLFVVAQTPARAIDLWNDACVEKGWPRCDDDEEVGLPRGRSVDPSNVREILPDVTGTPHDGAERAIDWEELALVA